jgi:hypothetical protein
MSQTANESEVVRKRSGWILPLAVFLVTAVLSALVLLYYLAPTPSSLGKEQVAPTALNQIVHIQIGKAALAIPANYIQRASAREGGARNDVALFALLPDMRGWSEGEAWKFASNASDSSVLYFLIREEPLNLTEQNRLDRIYMAYVVNPGGNPGPFGLTHYIFRDDSGYHGEDLFVGHTETGIAVFRCVKLSQQVPSPSCMRDINFGNGVAVSYRFKRAFLSRWQTIDANTSKLLASFVKPQPR